MGKSCTYEILFHTDETLSESLKEDLQKQTPLLLERFCDVVSAQWCFVNQHSGSVTVETTHMLSDEKWQQLVTDVEQFVKRVSSSKHSFMEDNYAKKISK